MRFPGLVVIAVGLFTLLIGGQINGGESPDAAIVFRLCQSHVETVELHKERDETRIYVKLAAIASTEFTALIERHVGAILLVTAGESVVSSAIIRSRIDSGVLVSKPLREDEARHLFSVLKEGLPESPCGVAQQGAPADRSTATRFRVG